MGSRYVRPTVNFFCNRSRQKQKTTTNSTNYTNHFLADTYPHLSTSGNIRRFKLGKKKGPEERKRDPKNFKTGRKNWIGKMVERGYLRGLFRPIFFRMAHLVASDRLQETRHYSYYSKAITRLSNKLLLATNGMYLAVSWPFRGCDVFSTTVTILLTCIFGVTLVANSK